MVKQSIEERLEELESRIKGVQRIVNDLHKRVVERELIKQTKGNKK